MMHPVKQEQVEEYLPVALDIIMRRKNDTMRKLGTKEKVIVTKIVQNVNKICKLSKKQVVEILRTAPSYQPVLAQLFFEQTINDWRLITNETSSQHPAIALTALSQQCVGVQYKIQFTLSSISKKKTVKAIILLVLFLADGSQFPIYLGLPEFEKLRYQIADAMRSIYSIEMKTLF